MYPLLLEPIIKTALWGSEDWMVTCRKDGMNRVTNGPLAGRPLEEVLREWGLTTPFPWLIKRINAREALSVQVHPEDPYALANEGAPGKTELWIVLDAAPGAGLIYGFNRCLSKEELERRIREGTLEEVLNTVPTKKGDVFFLPAGTLHAIGGGLTVAEIQQNSNITYRVWDYDRADKAGNRRELHIDKAVAVTHLTPAPKAPGALPLECPYFRVDRLCLRGTADLPAKDGLCALWVLDGKAALTWAEGDLNLQAGDSLLLPPGLSAALCGNADILITT